MPEFDIDQLKSAWKDQPTAEIYSQHEILQMLNKKSRNYVKYIFWIIAAEFLVFLLVGIAYMFQDDADSSFIRLMQKLGLKNTYRLRMNFEHLYFLMKVVSLLVTGIFVVRFYYNYSKIKVEDNLRQFIQKIIRFRRTVHIFIAANLALVVIYIITLALFVVQSINEQNITLQGSTAKGLFAGFLIGTILGLALIWLYYRLVYGLIIKKLERSLSQLQEIEKE